MEPALAEIKVLRKQLGLTQTQLAKQAGVSQSLIAKIEAGNIDPTYTNAQKIFAALHALHAQSEPKAKDWLNPHIVQLSPSDSIRTAVEKMKRYDISQLPVMERNQAVGIISESLLLDALVEGNVRTIGEIMADAPPQLTKETPVSAVLHLLKFAPLVLVSDRGKLCGVITKADVLKRKLEGK